MCPECPTSIVRVYLFCDLSILDQQFGVITVSYSRSSISLVLSFLFYFNFFIFNHQVLYHHRYNIKKNYNNSCANICEGTHTHIMSASD